MKRDTDKLAFSGQLPEGFDTAFDRVGPLLGFTRGDDGTAVTVFRGEGLTVEKGAGGIRLGWEKPVQLYRALSLLREGWDQAAFSRRERPCFETAALFDVSRNAVLRPGTVEELLCRMALMGMDAGMLYTEDTYEVPGEPYFGYMRGRYTQEELRRLDDYAAALGIELIPCIQVLGHLNRVIRWPAMYRYSDNGEVLLADSEDTYALLRRMITAACAPYRSRRIHLCMDEAHGIGLGAHLRKHGYESPHAIILRHLKRVKEITDSLGLSPMIWSDMYFRPDSPTNGYYDSGDPTSEAIASVVPGVELVYWDYYHNEEREYEAMLDKHRKLSGTPYFAGGIWTFTGPAPDYEKTIGASLPALRACQKAGVPFVIAAAWGDNGAEASLVTALPGLQLFAEFSYTGGYDGGWLAQRFQTCCGADVDPFLGLSRFNTVPGMRPTALRPVNAAKFLLYQDPMVQLFARDTQGFDMAGHYAMLAEEYAGHARAGGRYGALMGFYAQLARVLAGKCRWHQSISAAVAEGDRLLAARLAGELEQVEAETEELRRLWRALWLETNKPYGFEVIDGRLGAVCARLETARVRVSAWAAGDRADGLEELRETPLPYTLREGGTLFGSYAVGEIVSACKIDV